MKSLFKKFLLLFSLAFILLAHSGDIDSGTQIIKAIQNFKDYRKGLQLSKGMKEEMFRILRRNNDLINKMAHSGKMPNSLYQAIQRDFSVFNKTVADEAAELVGCTNQTQISLKGASPRTDSDYIFSNIEKGKPVTSEQIEQAIKYYNTKMNERLGTHGVNYAKKLDTDLMANPKNISAEEFAKIARLNNDAYARPGAATAEAKKRIYETELQKWKDGGRVGEPPRLELTPEEIRAYQDEMNDFILKKKKKINHLKEKLKKGDLTPSELSDTRTELTLAEQQQAKYRSRLKEMTRIEEHNGVLTNGEETSTVWTKERASDRSISRRGMTERQVSRANEKQADISAGMDEIVTAKTNSRSLLNKARHLPKGDMVAREKFIDEAAKMANLFPPQQKLKFIDDLREVSGDDLARSITKKMKRLSKRAFNAKSFLQMLEKSENQTKRLQLIEAKKSAMETSGSELKTLKELEKIITEKDGNRFVTMMLKNPHGNKLMMGIIGAVGGSYLLKEMHNAWYQGGKRWNLSDAAFAITEFVPGGMSYHRAASKGVDAKTVFYFVKDVLYFQPPWAWPYVLAGDMAFLSINISDTVRVNSNQNGLVDILVYAGEYSKKGRFIRLKLPKKSTNSKRFIPKNDLLDFFFHTKIVVVPVSGLNLTYRISDLTKVSNEVLDKNFLQNDPVTAQLRTAAQQQLKAISHDESWARIEKGSYFSGVFEYGKWLTGYSTICEKSPEKWCKVFNLLKNKIVKRREFIKKNLMIPYLVRQAERKHAVWVMGYHPPKDKLAQVQKQIEALRHKSLNVNLVKEVGKRAQKVAREVAKNRETREKQNLAKGKYWQSALRTYQNIYQDMKKSTENIALKLNMPIGKIEKRILRFPWTGDYVKDAKSAKESRKRFYHDAWTVWVDTTKIKGATPTPNKLALDRKALSILAKVQFKWRMVLDHLGYTEDSTNSSSEFRKKYKIALQEVEALYRKADNFQTLVEKGSKIVHNPLHLGKQTAFAVKIIGKKLKRMQKEGVLKVIWYSPHGDFGSGGKGFSVNYATTHLLPVRVEAVVQDRRNPVMEGVLSIKIPVIIPKGVFRLTLNHAQPQSGESVRAKVEIPDRYINVYQFHYKWQGKGCLVEEDDRSHVVVNAPKSGTGTVSVVVYAENKKGEWVMLGTDTVSFTVSVKKNSEKKNKTVQKDKKKTTRSTKKSDKEENQKNVDTVNTPQAKNKEADSDSNNKERKTEGENRNQNSKSSNVKDKKIDIDRIASGIAKSIPHIDTTPKVPKHFKIKITPHLPSSIPVNKAILLKIVNLNGKKPVHLDWNCGNNYHDGYKILKSNGMMGYFFGTTISSVNVSVCATDADGKEAKETATVKILPSSKNLQYMSPVHYGDNYSIVLNSVNLPGGIVSSSRDGGEENIVEFKDYTDYERWENDSKIHKYTEKFVSSKKGVIYKNGKVTFTELGSVDMWFNILVDGKIQGESQHLRTIVLPKDNAPIDINDTSAPKNSAESNIMAPSEANKELKISISVTPSTKIPLGEKIKIRVNVSGGTPPYRYHWSGAKGNLGSAILSAKKIGRQKISVMVTDSNKKSAVKSLMIEIVKPKLKVIGLKPEYFFSQKAVLRVQSNDKMAKMKPIWQTDSHSGISFNPPDGMKTTVTLSHKGNIGIWVYLTDEKGKLIVESKRVHTVVKLPEFSLKADNKHPYIGEKVLIGVQATPKIDDNAVSFWWEVKGGKTINPGPEINVPNQRAYSFTTKDEESVTVTVHAKAKDDGSELGKKSLTIKPQQYSVSVSKPRRLDKAPWKWDPIQGKAVEMPLAIAVFQNAEVHATIKPKPKGKLSYMWTVTPEGCSVSSPFSQSTNLNAHETGTYKVSVKVSDKNGAELGKGSTSFNVTVSQRDLEIAKQKAKDQKKAQKLLQEARKLWEEGKLQQAIAKVAHAQKLAGKDKPISETLKTMLQQKKDEDSKLKEAVGLIKKEKLKEAEKVLLDSSKINDKYPIYIKVLIQLSDAKKKAKEKKKQLIKLLKNAETLKSSGKLSEASMVLKIGSNQFPANKDIAKLLKEVQKQQNDALGKVAEGQTEWKSGMLDKAVSTLKKATKIDPSNRQITEILKGMQEKKKTLDDAILRAGKLIKGKKLTDAENILKRVERIGNGYPPYEEMKKSTTFAKQEDNRHKKELAEKIRKLKEKAKKDALKEKIRKLKDKAEKEAVAEKIWQQKKEDKKRALADKIRKLRDEAEREAVAEKIRKQKEKKEALAEKIRKLREEAKRKALAEKIRKIREKAKRDSNSASLPTMTNASSYTSKKPIKIISATYGANCGVTKGNVTNYIAKQCNGKSRCRYVVDYKKIGDPAYGCKKIYSVEFQCGYDSHIYKESLAAEAGWGDKSVLLDCQRLSTREAVGRDQVGSVIETSTKKFKGSLSGTWKEEDEWAKGSFVMNISENGKVSDRYWGDDKGSLGGTVSGSGELSVRSGGGSAGSGRWGGSIRIDSSGRLHGNGTWNVKNYKGTWQGKGRSVQKNRQSVGTFVCPRHGNKAIHKYSFNKHTSEKQPLAACSYHDDGTLYFAHYFKNGRPYIEEEWYRNGKLKERSNEETHTYVHYNWEGTIDRSGKF